MNRIAKTAFVLFCTATLSAQQAKTGKPQTERACGPLAGQLLKCPRFGFAYSVSFGWVDRTAEMTEPQSADSADALASQTLLAVFERPPDASGETINSAVVIATESLKNYRGVKTAADYFGPVTDLAEQRGFKVENEPYEFAVGAKKLVRADYNKPRGKLTMFQSTLAMIEKGDVVSFTFVGGSQDEVEELITKLRFGAMTVRQK